MSEIQPLVDHGENTTINYELDIDNETDKREEEFHGKVYKRRWWILFVFSFSGWTHGVGYVTLTTISDSIQIAYGWSIFSIAMAPASMSLALVASCIPVMYIIQAKGLRVGMIIASTTLAAGSILWVISVHTQWYWLIVAGYILYGVAGAVSIAGSALLSVTWFPVSQRTTATAIAYLNSIFGITVGSTVAPQFMGGSVVPDDFEHRHNFSSEFISSLQENIQHLMYFDAALGLVLFILVIVYFPPAPPQPPSRSQTIKREEFRHSLKKLLTNSQYLMSALIASLCIGVFTAWLPILAVGFRHLGITEEEAGWVVFTSMLIGCLCSIPTSLLADKFQRRSKVYLKVFLTAMLLSVLLTACIQERYITMSHQSLQAALYVLCIAIAITSLASTPLIVELACDYAYPVYEGLAGALVMIPSYLAIFTLYVLFLVPSFSQDPSWMSWTYLGYCSVCTFLTFLLKDDFSRLDVDTASS